MLTISALAKVNDIEFYMDFQVTETLHRDVDAQRSQPSISMVLATKQTQTMRS